jgi:hypothetical protein
MTRHKEWEDSNGNMSSWSSWTACEVRVFLKVSCDESKINIEPLEKSNNSKKYH